MYVFLATALILISGTFSGCAYHFGLSERALPGGYTQVDIPIFKNKSAEVGVEPLFTNALIRRFERSQAARVTDKSSAPLTLEGTIKKIDIVQGVPLDYTSISTLPTNAILVSEYRLDVTAEIVLKRKSDDKVVWQGTFSGQKVYDPPRVGTQLVNSANATYNQSVKMQTLGLLAEEMMAEAHDRITENY